MFLFAPRHHAALRHAAGPRVELGTRTIFNLLGPLANPARVRRQLTGVFDPSWARPMAETLRALGTERAWVVHGQGLDELTVAGENHVVALRGRRDPRVHRRPRPRCRPAAPARSAPSGAATPQHNAAALLAVAAGRARRLSRHRAAERGGRADRGRPRGRSAGRRVACRRGPSTAAPRLPRWTGCAARPPRRPDHGRRQFPTRWRRSAPTRMPRRPPAAGPRDAAASSCRRKVAHAATAPRNFGPALKQRGGRRRLRADRRDQEGVALGRADPPRFRPGRPRPHLRKRPAPPACRC